MSYNFLVREVDEYERIKLMALCVRLGIDNAVECTDHTELRDNATGIKIVDGKPDDDELLHLLSIHGVVVWCGSCKEYHDIDVPIPCVLDLSGYDPHDSL